MNLSAKQQLTPAAPGTILHGLDTVCQLIKSSLHTGTSIVRASSPFYACPKMSSSTFHMKTARSPLPIDTTWASLAVNLTHETPPTWPETSLYPACKSGNAISKHNSDETIVKTAQNIFHLVHKRASPSHVVNLTLAAWLVG